MDNLHHIEFHVALTHSKLFDMHIKYLALKLRNKFPGIEVTEDETGYLIHGDLNDYWFERWNRAVFEIGTIEGEDDI